MDQTYLLILAVAVVAAVMALGAMRAQSKTPTTPDGSDSPFGVSTEGMKMCPKCRMGNLWTERRCSACGSPLRG